MRTAFRTAFITIPALTMALLAIPAEGRAQIPGLDRLRNTVENEVENQVNNMARDAVRCAMGDTRCADEARANGNTPVFEDANGNIITDADGNPITDPQAAQAATDDPGTGIWRNYDFVPGSEVLYAMDLTGEPVGRIPARQIEYLSGNFQVVELDGVKTLEFTDASIFRVPLPRNLPDDFTVEFEFQAAAPNVAMRVLTEGNEGLNLRTYEYHYLDLYRSSGIAAHADQLSSIDPVPGIAEHFVPFKLQVDGSPDAPDYAILYAGTDRAQVPNADFGRASHVEFQVNANGNRHAYLRNIVVAAHGDPLYEALVVNHSEFTTRGILYDVNSARIRPESTPTLQELATTLEQNADLAVIIEGHTDSDGDEDYNQDLSQRRAESVVAYLTSQGIDGSRLQARGMGESQPVADNSTEAGRQQNRRVVIIAQ
jgi:OOP family OmpA-OmpF porin